MGVIDMCYLRCRAWINSSRRRRRLPNYIRNCSVRWALTQPELHANLVNRKIKRIHRKHQNRRARQMQFRFWEIAGRLRVHKTVSITRNLICTSSIHPSLPHSALASSHFESSLLIMTIENSRPRHENRIFIWRVAICLELFALKIAIRMSYGYGKRVKCARDEAR